MPNVGLCVLCIYRMYSEAPDEDDPVGNLWIGLFNEEQFANAAACRVDTGDYTETEITQCRNNFVWVDGSGITNFQPWRFQEPNTENDKCVRLERNQWAASPCDLELGYICRGGK